LVVVTAHGRDGMGLPLLHVLSGAAFSAVAAVNGTSSPAVRSAGCGLAPPYDPAEQRNSERIDIDGRWYLLHLPAGTPDGGGVVYDRDVAHPLIMNFHGMGMGPRAEQSWTGLTPLSNQQGAIVVYPAGFADCSGNDCWTSWNASGTAIGTSPDGEPTCTNATEPYIACFNSCRSEGLCNPPDGPLDPPCNVASCVDDVAFAERMLDHLEATLCIDRSRVQVTGNSMGGLMAMQVAASLPDRVATVVPMTAVPLRGYARELVPRVEGMGISVMSIVGNFDQVMPKEGGESYEGFVYDSQAQYMDAWAAYHGALPGPPNVQYDVGPDPWRELRCLSYAWPSGGPPPNTGIVVSCSLNIGHNGEQRPYAPALKWAFLRDHPRLMSAAAAGGES
jgi:poly(3-hydroxybutyrate) depolymerase